MRPSEAIENVGRKSAPEVLLQFQFIWVLQSYSNEITLLQAEVAIPEIFSNGPIHSIHRQQDIAAGGRCRPEVEPSFYDRWGCPQ